MPLHKEPDECSSKQDIRAEIDALDEQLVQLFARRQQYVRRMAELKQHPSEAFDKERIETLVAAIAGRAEQLGLESEQAELIWRTLIDWNIDYEKRAIAARLEANQR